MLLNRSLLTVGFIAVLASGCADSGPVAVTQVERTSTDQADLFGGRLAISAGQGQYAVGTIPVDFSYAAVQVSAGRTIARGKFKQSLTLNGLLVEFEGRVTCMGIDETNGRAWIAGVITKNNSLNPSFQTAIHQVGKDVWFRVVDYGEGGNATQPDRTTFLGFEGGAGIITSAQYCAEKPWPANDERTNALTAGNLQVF